MMSMRGRVVDVDLADVDGWCRANLRAGIAQVLFREGYLSTVLGVLLSSGASVVIKVRRWAERLEACGIVHQQLFLRGFPCPEPLTGLQPLGEWAASAEASVSGGATIPSSGRSSAPFAQALARLIALAPDPAELPSLDPPMPWTTPDPREPSLWPWSDDRDIDLNTVGGPTWIDDAGHAARARLERSRPQPVVGHGDWYTGNLRWAGNQLHVAWDWDSVIAANEAVVVGLAAAVYPATRSGTEGTVLETQAFLDAYQLARGRPFGADEIEEAWAAGLWNRSFDAKKQLATEGRPRSLTQDEAHERTRRATAK